tara:strand:- start:229 stop:555 length:327 start_codon:yes stop_codon:yes gene_type:complete
MATNKEILDVLERIENSLPNGDLDICRAHLVDLQEGQTKLAESMNSISNLITDPEDGLIVRINKNTYWRRQITPQDVTDLKQFKSAVIKALWIIFPTLLTMVGYVIFG